ncbi:D-serine deaminase-like pyridoxal phosphate-dependent protein [Prauserella sediminis]|uniref:D-serine deaminase-like pyridoxal phosphate-dependent protein n=1 Tax=Prauserella sediminis TaxID=577680 RepID=A0A839Y0J4_9PSEU|nr:alanine racemase [Prauserella sediminis]MBB3665475.1 D-serine deaminase-like pyridoxal phosphate-dependent protein [Prauserella sediminis]
MHRLQSALDAVVESIDTPAPIVLADVVQDNIDRMQDFASRHGLDVRPHVKTHKCVEIGRRQIEAGACGITAGNVGEAEVFARAGFDDIFIAYPVWPAGTKRHRVRQLAGSTRLRIGVDNVAAVDALAGAMGDEPERLHIVVEVDCGARRSGAPPEVAAEVALAARDRGLVPAGVFTYPGHGGSARGARERAAADQRSALSTAVRTLERAGLDPEVVSAGSTPTVEFSTGDPITEIRPGEYVFGDLDNTRLGACSEDQVALFVAATVVSNWIPGQAIVDTGTKALGREGHPDKGYGRVAGMDAVLAKLNEYHGFVALPPGVAQPEIGELVPVVPNHVCPVVTNFEEFIVTDSEGASLQRWPVDARGFLN